MKRLSLALAAGVVLPLISYSAAHAATTTRSCSAGGFTGTIQVIHDADTYRITRINYRINKGSNSGGNSANIYWRDEATLPATILSTGSARQDNTLRTFWDTPYNRGGGAAAVRFTFDKSNAGDPSCTISGIL